MCCPSLSRDKWPSTVKKKRFLQSLRLYNSMFGAESTLRRDEVIGQPAGLLGKALTEKYPVRGMCWGADEQALMYG